MKPNYRSELFIIESDSNIKYSKKYDFLLSIIVPVYNIEKYLGKCLDSLSSQSLKNYEVIVVNDGCTDNSQLIIDKYVNDYPAIFKSFVKENGGLSDARNYGIEKANGKYICFLDSDDYVDLDYYENICELAEDNNLDLVVSDIEYYWENSSQKNFIKEGLSNVNVEINKRLFFSPLFAWNKLYRRELFDKLNCRYPVGLWYEDIPVSLKYFANAERIGHYHEVGVHYLQRESSILGTRYSDKMYEIFTIFDKVVSSFKENNLFEKYKNELEYLFIEHFLVYGAFRFLRTPKYKDLMVKAFDYVKKCFPDYRRNIYIGIIGKKNEIFFRTNNRMTMYFWHWYLTK